MFLQNSQVAVDIKIQKKNFNAIDRKYWVKITNNTSEELSPVSSFPSKS